MKESLKKTIDKKNVAKIEKLYKNLDKNDKFYYEKLEEISKLVENLYCDSSKLYVGLHISNKLISRNVIFSMERNSNKIKALKLNPKKDIADELRNTNSISPLLIIKNIKFFIRTQLGAKVPDYEINRRAEMLKRMEKKNGGISKVINYKLLDKKYVDFLGEDRISYLGLFKRQTDQLLNLKDKELKVIKILYKEYFKVNDTNDWQVWLQQMMNGIEFVNKIQKEYNERLIKEGKPVISDSFFDNIDLDKVDLNNLSEILLTNYPTFLEKKMLKKMRKGKIEDIEDIQKKFLDQKGNPLKMIYPSVMNNCEWIPHVIYEPDGTWMPAVIGKNGNIQTLGKKGDYRYACEMAYDFANKFAKNGNIVGLFGEDGVFQNGASYEALPNGQYKAIVFLDNGQKFDSGLIFNNIHDAKRCAIESAYTIEKYGWVNDEINFSKLSNKEIKELIYFKAFRIPLYEDKDDNFTLDVRKGVNWLLKAYGQDIDKLEESPYKEIIKIMKYVNEINDPIELKRIFNKIKNGNAIDIIQLESNLKKEYLKLYNNQIIDPKKLHKNKDGFYETGENFMTIMTTVGAYSGVTSSENAKEDWNRKSLASQHFCTSLISNEMMGCCFREGKVCYGFSNLDKDSFLLSGSVDLFSSSGQNFGVWNKNDKFSRPIEFLEPQHMIESTYRGYNELDFRRSQHGAKNDPSYILVFKVDGQYKNLKESKAASKSFNNLPIVTIDVSKYMETNTQKLCELDRQYAELCKIGNKQKMAEHLEYMQKYIKMNLNSINAFWKNDYNKLNRFGIWYKFNNLLNCKDVDDFIKNAKREKAIEEQQFEQATQKVKSKEVINSLEKLEMYNNYKKISSKEISLIAKDKLVADEAENALEAISNLEKEKNENDKEKNE